MLMTALSDITPNRDFRDKIAEDKKKIDELEREILKSEPTARLASSLKEYHLYSANCGKLTAHIALRAGYYRGYSEETLRELATAGVLINIGNMNIPREVLNKEKGLTVEEFERIKESPRLGKEIVEKVGLKNTICDYIYRSREMSDGSGYPNHLTGAELGGMQVLLNTAYRYTSMTCEKTYRRPYPSHVAYDILNTMISCNLDLRAIEDIKISEMLYEQSSRY